MWGAVPDEASPLFEYCSLHLLTKLWLIACEVFHEKHYYNKESTGSFINISEHSPAANQRTSRFSPIVLQIQHSGAPGDSLADCNGVIESIFEVNSHMHSIFHACQAVAD